MSLNKYALACIEYAEASAELRQAKKAVGDHLGACLRVRAEEFEQANPDMVFQDETMKSPHLTAAYAMEDDPDGWPFYARIHTNHDGDVEDYLATVCPHCLEAHRAIEAKRAAAKRLGIAKRRIQALGRNAA